MALNPSFYDSHPHFPSEDLSEESSEYLELLLQNASIVEQSHPIAERQKLLFRLAHSEASIASDAFAADDYHDAFLYGFTLYEIISSLVAPTPIITRDAVSVTAAKSLRSVLHSNHLPDFLSDAYEELFTEQKNTFRVIETAGGRHFKGIGHYVVMGAAMERQLEMEARQLDENIVQ